LPWAAGDVDVAFAAVGQGPDWVSSPYDPEVKDAEAGALKRAALMESEQPGNSYA